MVNLTRITASDFGAAEDYHLTNDSAFEDEYKDQTYIFALNIVGYKVSTFMADSGQKSS